MSFAQAQDLKFFKLGNGMSVYIWEDHSKPEVLGSVAVATGSTNDPEQYTGLAHYLEHMMFKGTSKIGTVDWEKEAPIYQKIIGKYDEYSSTVDETARAAISKEINELSIEESKLSVLNEYANLIEGIGGSGLNAGTSYDQTVYYNYFPSNQISKWLPLAAERFKDPVFRAFQSELETVYEEYNMYNDNPSSRESDFMLSTIFEGSAYGRQVIGLGEHLKNPRLSQLIKFYNDWYVPSNMALVLVGDVETAKVMRLINATFGRLAPKPVPERKMEVPFNVTGRKQVKYNEAQIPSVVLAYNGVKRGDKDESALEICISLLSNRFGTGLLDKQVIAGELLNAGASSFSLRDAGRIIIEGIPYYDEAQRSFDSSRKVEKILTEAIGKLSAGDIDTTVLATIKTSMCRDYDLEMEQAESKAGKIWDIFVCNLDVNAELQYKDHVMAVTVDDIRRVASKYFNGNYISMFNEQGKTGKGLKIKKPDIKPLTPVKGQSSAYAGWFRSMQAPAYDETPVDWNKVQEKQINTYSRLYYTQNTRNDVFTLILKYGANSSLLPKLKYGASLMNSAGIMASFDSKEIKEEFARLGATYSVRTDEDYLYVILRGYEDNLKEDCLLLTRLLLMPKLDKKQLGNVIGGAATERFIRKDDLDYLSEALRDYIEYGDESKYKKELTDNELINMDIASLTGSVLEATNYAAEIHYSGMMPFEQVSGILSSCLPLKENEKASSSPLVRPMKDYDGNTVVFVPNSSFQQAQIWFYIPMGEYDKSLEVKRAAFNRYIGGSFNGLVMQEIREYNSMAYTAFASVLSREYPGSGQGLTGYVGTQNDKAYDAIKLFTSILTDMPQHPEMIESIRSFLMADVLSKPDDRLLSRYIADWKLKGYNADPAVEQLQQIKDLKFEDIIEYYNTYVKGKPIVIGVVGSPKNLSVKQLSEFGKVKQISEKSLFNEKDVLF